MTSMLYEKTSDYSSTSLPFGGFWIQAGSVPLENLDSRGRVWAKLFCFLIFISTKVGSDGLLNPTGSSNQFPILVASARSPAFDSGRSRLVAFRVPA